MYQMRWAIVPPCVTFGPLFLIMGIGSDGQLLLIGAMMTIVGWAILLHGIFTRQLPGPPPYHRANLDFFSGIVIGVGLGCMLAAALLHDLSVDSLRYVGLALVFVGALLKPQIATLSASSNGTD